jgi:hypothetical protein
MDYLIPYTAFLIFTYFIVFVVFQYKKEREIINELKDQYKRITKEVRSDFISSIKRDKDLRNDLEHLNHLIKALNYRICKLEKGSNE